ncbi:hypothetical protein [Tropicibacter naphthalenivorans]|uniref:Putative metal-dependent hydrolase of the TIM-barrel fold protein n=1 Tax=Tropicibacter naphthalenivorans TaxID=441103 RepID=A0A0P1GGC5_9RHOB|nr:hypothetical protein [Tropicibacter naphthalenivorans]CUH75432.1 putative metal-dependent hydrolase of the TIM-barrel fold protein [Tropicibacter naphthalenivorans]SMC44497.1 hypothetical protein SAMN04488093_101443 [Tropicibacter naphthalenivorans]
MTKQYPFIDMHAHFFNGAYLPLHGILLSWDVKALLAKPAARLLQSLVFLSRFREASLVGDLRPDEQELVDAIQSGDPDLLMNSAVRRALKVIEDLSEGSLDDPSVFDHLRQISDAIRDMSRYFELDRHGVVPGTTIRKSLHGAQMDRDQLAQDLAEVLFHALPEIAEAAEHSSLMDHHASHAARSPHDDYPPSPEGSALIQKGLPVGQLGSTKQLLLFVISMLCSERTRLRLIRSDYAKGKPADGYDPEHLISLLPDLGSAYEEQHGKLLPPRVDAIQQMRRTVALAGESGGQIVPFGSVEPFSRDAHRSYWREKVEFGREMGITGFKIYPPSGFRAIDPALLPAGGRYGPDYITPIDPQHSDYYQTAQTFQNFSRINEVMEEILRYFSDNQLRLFTHCTPEGFEARTGLGVNADPAFWDMAMIQYEATDLWLCLGHGGGHTRWDWGGWTAQEADWPNTFAYKVVDMCRRYPNVYCDFGYLTDILGKSEAAQIRRDRMLERLEALLLDTETTAEHPYKFSDKVVFGTDWSMPHMIGETRAYLDAFLAFFDRSPALAARAPAFFHGNARRYLGMPAVG